MIQEGTYKVICGACKSEISVQLGSEDINGQETIEEQPRSMGEETTYRLSHHVVCPKCGKATDEIELHEYPDGAYNYGEAK